MADTLLLRALKCQPKVLKLSSKKLEKVPKAIGRLSCITHLELRNNKLKVLPPEIAELFQLHTLNLGNNVFEELPEVLQHLQTLQKLHIFNNKVSSLSSVVLSYLPNLSFLNLNNNELTSLPIEIHRLVNLQHLSIDNNKLSQIPSEFCALSRLEELHAANNQLTSLPLEFGFLISLEKLHIQKNKIRELPESIGKCYRLRLLDIAANELRIFPTEIAGIPLKELYCEENPLLQHIPVHSVQEDEVLTLKEIIARFVMKELKDRLFVTEEETASEDGWSYLRRSIRHFPQIRDMLAQSSRCALCGEAFLNTWLECVQFIDARKVMQLTSISGQIPVRALLCSYKCFNMPGHDYYGVAFP